MVGGGRTRGTENHAQLEQLADSARRLRLIVDTAYEGFISIGAEGEVIDWNPQAEEIFGWSREEALGRQLADTIIPEGYREAHRAGLKRFLETGEQNVLGQRLELSAIRRDGSEFPVELTISAVETQDGHSFHAFLRDISARKQTERYLAAERGVAVALAESSSIDEAMPRVLAAIAQGFEFEVAAWWTFDELANLLRCAEVWLAPERTADTFVSATREATFAPGVGLPGRIWSTGEPAWVEDVTADPNFPRAPAATKDGLHGAFGLPLYADGAIVGVVEFFAGELRPPDGELLAMSKTITQHIGSFIEREHAKQEADRLKDEFFAMVSHELSTPLTSILGYLQILREEEAALDAQKQTLEILERNAQRLRRLVSDLLFVAQLAGGRMALHNGEVDLAAVVRESVAAALPNASEHGVELSLESEVQAVCPGDATRLGQAIDNLTANAIKFTKPGGKVTLKMLESGDQAIRIEIADTGLGIPADERERLFERFFRASNAVKQSVPGIGLGLTIVKAIVDGHRGQIGVESEPGVGTTFWIELPTVSAPDSHE